MNIKIKIFVNLFFCFGVGIEPGSIDSITGYTVRTSDKDYEMLTGAPVCKLYY